MIVEVAYARPDTQVIITIDVDEPCTLEQAIKASGILDKFPEIDLNSANVGIFSKLTKLSDVLREKDRVEIYRSLIADPKESRRKRATKKEKTVSD